MRQQMRTLVLSILLLIASLFLMYSNYYPTCLGTPLTLGAVSLSGFEEIKPGIFHANKAPTNFHSLRLPITLNPKSYYHIQYNVTQLAPEKITVSTSFNGPNYDHIEQNNNTLYGMNNNLQKPQSFMLNSGSPSKDTVLRIFYTGEPGFTISNIDVTQLNTGWIWFKQLSLLAAISLTFFSMIRLLKSRRDTNASTRRKDTRFNTRASEWPMLFCLYFFAVIIHYVLYILMPYSSGDEYAYKTIAASIWHFGQPDVNTNTPMPNLLYPYLISISFALEENFYFGIRLINALIINMAIFPCYFIARKFLNISASLLIALISIAIPFLNFGAFAVTEVLFLPLFMLFIWVSIESIKNNLSFKWLVAVGIMLAILLNARLTTLVLFPAYLISVIWVSKWKPTTLNVFIELKRIFYIIIPFLVSYILLQYFLNVQKIGALGAYQVVADHGGIFSILFHNPAEILYLILGHLTTLSIPYALPIAFTITALFTNRSKWSTNNHLYPLLVITSVFSLALFMFAIAITIKVSPFDAGGLARWHSRYYFYFYPLLIIVGGIFFQDKQLTININRTKVIVIVTILLLANIYFVKIHDGVQSQWFGALADNMDVQWYRPLNIFYWFFILFTGLLSWLWYKRSVYLNKMGLCFIFLWILVANTGTLLTANIGSGARADMCSSLSQHYLNQYPGRFIVVADTYPASVATTFWNPYVPEKVIQYSDTSKPFSIVSDANYLVASGQIKVDPIYQPLISMGSCTIYKLKQSL